MLNVKVRPAVKPQQCESAWPRTWISIISFLYAIMVHVRQGRSETTKLQASTRPHRVLYLGDLVQVVPVKRLGVREDEAANDGDEQGDTQREDVASQQWRVQASGVNRHLPIADLGVGHPGRHAADAAC